MQINKISQSLFNTNHNIYQNSTNNIIFASNTIDFNNIKYLNNINKSLINFNGYYQTLNENYFNLPTDTNTGKPFQPDIYQKAAAENLYKGNDVIVTAPTGTGKTAIAHYIINKNLIEGKKTFYTTPLKALSNDKVREFQKIYGKENVGLITGDKKINKDAPIVIMTTEVYRNMVVKNILSENNPLLNDVKTVVFDELHYLGDSDRGSVWEQSIIFSNPKTQLLSLSGTMANPEKITDWMASVKGSKYSEKVTPDENYRAKDINTHTVLINVPPEKRHVPLKYETLNVKAYQPKIKNNNKHNVKNKKNISVQNQSPDSEQPSRASYVDVVKRLKKEDKLPAIIFIFSKREGKAVVKYLSENAEPLTSKAELKEIEQILSNYRKQGKYLGESLDVPSLKNGYAVHNAGMLPEQKELIEELFQKKLIKVVISTETLSAGINMPARTTVITTLRKPTDNPDDSDHKRYITSNEFHQMAGRAGRRGIDKIGYCYALATNKSQRDKFEKLINTPSNNIESHFNIDYSFVATANDAYRDKTQLKEIFKKSLQAYDKNPDKIVQNAKLMTSEFLRKEKILKEFGYLDNDNQTTIKGQLLSMLNGYHQIPIIDSITSGELKELNPIQLAAYIGGLATLDDEILTSESKKQYENKSDFYIQDNTLYNLVNKFDRKKFIYDYNIYKPINKQLKFNKLAINHLYDWASKNKYNPNSTKNWKEIYLDYIKGTRNDEGKVFKEIMMTIDLLKQIEEIAQKGAEISSKEKDIQYYKNLSETAKQSISLLNQPPTFTDDIN